MIVVLAGDGVVGERVSRELAQFLPQTTVLQPGYFVPIQKPSDRSVGAHDDTQEAAWIAETLAASARRISAHGGTGVIVLPRLESVSSLMVAFDQESAPLYLFLLREPARHQGIFRRGEVIDAMSGDTETMAQRIFELATAGKGLIRPAPVGTGDSSLLPSEGGPSTGVDIVEIARIARIVERYGERFLKRVYTEAEQALYRGRVPELAARFAAKEAVSKALGTGIWGIRWREMEILPDMRGKPLVYLHGAAAARARTLNLRHFAVSLSHSRDFAMAVVVAT